MSSQYYFGLSVEELLLAKCICDKVTRQILYLIKLIYNNQSMNTHQKISSSQTCVSDETVY